MHINKAREIHNIFEIAEDPMESMRRMHQANYNDRVREASYSRELAKLGGESVINWVETIYPFVLNNIKRAAENKKTAYAYDLCIPSVPKPQSRTVAAADLIISKIHQDGFEASKEWTYHSPCSLEEGFHSWVIHIRW